MPKDRFLLIKSWGCGFWSDVDHVMGQLLAAELTNRTPVIYWGPNSLYAKSFQSNAFDLYFEPVSEYTIQDLVRRGIRFIHPSGMRGTSWSRTSTKSPGRSAISAT